MSNRESKYNYSALLSTLTHAVRLMRGSDYTIDIGNQTFPTEPVRCRLTIPWVYRVSDGVSADALSAAQPYRMFEYYVKILGLVLDTLSQAGFLVWYLNDYDPLGVIVYIDGVKWVGNGFTLVDEGALIV